MPDPRLATIDDVEAALAGSEAEEVLHGIAPDILVEAVNLVIWYLNGREDD